MNIRKSKPRGAILEELQKIKTHPRGDELYDIVRRRLPQISLGTVYRNLDLLRRQGRVAAIFCGDFNRYDGDISSHPHFLCRRCKRLWDFEASGIPEKIEPVREDDVFQVEGHYIVFYGLCDRCPSE
ncbi:MAG: transcriptional repressor [Dehalococcoidales bacterium]|nr:transcriptional repressor [Dehalococcoidales bacterium]MDP6737453.1 transcriptional repressor [Dehalococcoidales bacterium]